ncbi:hypothetical protein [Alteromonas aestuariivivens]|nr:hypothetical protein [Alteromonas aestuariivivens]
MPDRSGIVVFNRNTFTTQFIQNPFVEQLKADPVSGEVDWNWLQSQCGQNQDAHGFLSDLVDLGLVDGGSRDH